jgi:hypothetical protein
VWSKGICLIDWQQDRSMISSLRKKAMKKEILKKYVVGRKDSRSQFLRPV